MTTGLSRRGFFHVAGAGIGLLALPPLVHAAPTMQTLRASAASVDLIGADRERPADYSATDVWAYDGAVPGPLLRGRVGERLRIRLQNDIEEPTSVHWHGIRIDNAMDGVPGLTQDPVQPGESFDYDFELTHPGTYWYHPHMRSSQQVGRGLYGMLIVDEAKPLDVDRDLLLVIDDWRINAEGQIDIASFGNLHDAAHGGRLGNWMTVNGQSGPVLPVKAGERVRLRVANVANARIFEIDTEKLGAVALSRDGHGLDKAAKPQDPVLLGPGQREDLVFDVPEGAQTIPIQDVSTGEPVTAATLKVEPSDGAPSQRPALDTLSLPRFGTEPDTDNARVVDLVMEGGAMGGLATANLDGESMSLQEIAQKGYVWAFNGRVGKMDYRLFEAARGETIAIDMVNRTSWPHAMHMHGHHFRILTRDGKPATDIAFRDTVLVGPEQSVRVAFVADNPGKWMLHCHMLEHQASGMVATFAVNG
ncbi:multicopper oxidase family protein [Tepidamorphus sp. 3E244]|uniref:multicopper oxidase family protein n=1 Tax=Tepidamorphus sp. 3E244 TaxID=3385498 RepID=UPI0038FC45D8